MHCCNKRKLCCKPQADTQITQPPIENNDRYDTDISLEEGRDTDKSSETLSASDTKCNKCCICKTNISNVVFAHNNGELICMHKCVCCKCVSKIEDHKCPLCRKDYETYNFVY